jgi:hypothetical protein
VVGLDQTCVRRTTLLQLLAQRLANLRAPRQLRAMSLLALLESGPEGSLDRGETLVTRQELLPCSYQPIARLTFERNELYEIFGRAIVGQIALVRLCHP